MIAGFDWDAGNRAKCQKHGVSITGIEELFVRPLLIIPDAAHSQDEQRFRAIGKTAKDRAIFVVFTICIRGKKQFIRPISARYMHNKEIKSYEEDNSKL